MSKIKHGFIQIQRQAEELFESDLDAYLLMTQIMFRALRKESKYNKHKLQINQALVGDYKAISLTRQRYRDAMDRIENRYRLASFKGTNKGTIATLLNVEFCDINCEKTNHQTNEKEPTENHQEEITKFHKLETYIEKTGTYDDQRTIKEPTENHQRTTKEECNNIINKEVITTTTPLPPKDEVVIPLFENGGGSSNSSYGDIVLKDPKGEEIYISENEIYQHFLRSHYSAEILKKAIQETRTTKTPVRDILRYIEAICERLQKKKDLIPSDNRKPRNDPPKCTDQGVYGGKYFNF
jgi:hypothetical protein